MLQVLDNIQLFHHLYKRYIVVYPLIWLNTFVSKHVRSAEL